jgi:hypothetical protein
MPGRQPWARFSPQVKSSQKVEKAEETKVQMAKSQRSGAEEPDSQFHRIANERITSLKFSQGRFLFAGLAAARKPAFTSQRRSILTTTARGM